MRKATKTCGNNNQNEHLQQYQTVFVYVCALQSSLWQLQFRQHLQPIQLPRLIAPFPVTSCVVVVYLLFV